VRVEGGKKLGVPTLELYAWIFAIATVRKHRLVKRFARLVLLLVLFGHAFCPSELITGVRFDLDKIALNMGLCAVIHCHLHFGWIAGFAAIAV